MAANSIGVFSFISLGKPGEPGSVPDLLQTEKKIIQRPGVNGTGIKHLGVKGQPFQLESLVDMPTRADAENLRFLYYALQSDQTKADLVLNGIDYGSFHNVRFVVLAVENTSIRRMTAAVGGLSNPSNFVVQAFWTLIPVHV